LFFVVTWSGFLCYKTSRWIW